MPAVFVLAFGHIYSFNFLLSTWRSQGPGFVCLRVCVSVRTDLIPLLSTGAPWAGRDFGARRRTPCCGLV